MQPRLFQGAEHPDYGLPNTGPGEMAFAGFAIVGIGIGVTMMDPWSRDVCARALRHPDIRAAGREVIARIVGK